MKTNLKNEMMEMVKATAIKEVNGVYEMTARQLRKVEANLNEKFVIATNKQDSNLHAIAYKTKKSEKLVIIKVVAETMKAKGKKVVKKVDNSEFKFSFEMKDDKGLNCHVCEFEMIADEDTFDSFIDVLNDKLANSELGEFGASAEYNMVDDVERGFAGQIIFTKIKGHSKDGYANYKKCLTATKREFKVA